MKDYSLAKMAYDAYCTSTGGVSLISGDKLPEFEVLKPAIQEAWDAAAGAVRLSFYREHDQAQLDHLKAQSALLYAQAELARAQARATDNMTDKQK
jgi:hypothetical protein